MPVASTDQLLGVPVHTVNYADASTSIAVDTTATPDTNVAIASANLNASSTFAEGFTFDAATGTLTFLCSGTYEIDVSALFAATLAAGAVQSMKVLIGATGAATTSLSLIPDMQTFREEGTATQKATLRVGGISPYITENTIMRVAFSSDTSNDAALVFAMHWRVSRISGTPGTAA